MILFPSRGCKFPKIFTNAFTSKLSSIEILPVTQQFWKKLTMKRKNMQRNLSTPGEKKVALQVKEQ